MNKKKFLSDIVEYKKDEVAKLKRNFSWNNLVDLGSQFSFGLSMKSAIVNAKGLGIIGEIKKASPSKGLLREDFDPQRIAEIYIEEGLAGISVLTEQNYFLGSPEYLKTLAKDKVIPLLRKDFIIHEIQIAESKSMGADCILLISELLSEAQISEYTHAALELGMEVLVELHSDDQIQKIDFGLNTLIGINNRNLITFETDILTTTTLMKLLPSSVTVISESGISTHDNVKRVRDAGIDGILVGENFMRSKDIQSEVRRMKEYCSD